MAVTVGLQAPDFTVQAYDRTKDGDDKQRFRTVKLADGTVLVGDHSDGYTPDWHVSEFTLFDLRWRRLDPEKVVTATGNLAGWVTNPDLSKVDEIGFVDLMPGSGHGNGGWSDLAWMEVWGKPVPRKK